MTENDDAWIAALLREGDAHVDDAGFTDRVVASLPPRRRRIATRDVAIGAFALVAAGVGALALSHGSGALFAFDAVHVGAVAVVVVVGLWGALAAAEG
jgi:hypothetical protein